MTAHIKLKLLLLVVTLLVTLTGLFQFAAAKTNTNKNAVLDDIVEHKEFKKLLRTRTNVLVLFVSSAKETANELRIYRDAALAIKGFGALVLIDCSASTERKKLCKKLKVAPERYVMKHYKDGDFHKEYDRQMSVSSLVNFMRDPTGDLPWEEDPIGADVVHFNDYVALTRHLGKDIRPMMIMFYVPWCGFCKRLKPQYSKTATELKSQGYVLAAMDLEKQGNAPARRVFNITGYPTLTYFEHGKFKQNYEGDTTKEAITAFMQDPSSVTAAIKSAKETDWATDANSDVVHLTTDGFDPALQDEKSVVVMFYAPWCGHCKRLKPNYETAAATLKERKIPGMLAAIDATKEPAIIERFKVKGYPTLKYFVNGVFKYEVSFQSAEQIVEFMKDPKEPPPPPPPDAPWEEDERNKEVFFLNDQNFNTTLKRKKYALVLFYAPWCGHCKKVKPEFTAAAERLKEDTRVLFGAVDCTLYASICNQQGVHGYPTIKYFSYLKLQMPYTGGRSRDDFVSYITNALVTIMSKDEL